MQIAKSKKGNYIIDLPNISSKERVEILQEFDDRWIKKASKYKYSCMFYLIHYHQLCLRQRSEIWRKEKKLQRP